MTVGAFHLRTLCFSLALCVASGCNAPSTEPTLTVTDAHIVAPVGNRTVALGGFHLSAEGKTLRLIDVSSPAADRVEFHQTLAAENGRLQMRRMPEVLVRSGETLTLGRGGPHLMLFGFDTDLKVGASTELTLTYQFGNDTIQSQTFTTSVRDISNDIADQKPGS